MRTFFFLAVMAAIATTAYFYGPSLFGSDTPRDPEALISEITGQSDRDAVGAGLEHVKQEAPQPMRAVERDVKPSRPPELRRKASVAPKKSSLPEAPAWAADPNGLKQKKKVATQNPAATPKGERNFSDPMKNRWIDELSGQKVKVSFSKGRVQEGCEYNLDQCEDIRNAKDAKLVGVIVKTRRLVDSPLHPVDGNVRSGHYAKGTPAMYFD